MFDFDGLEFSTDDDDSCEPRYNTHRPAGLGAAYAQGIFEQVHECRQGI